MGRQRLIANQSFKKKTNYDAFTKDSAGLKVGGDSDPPRGGGTEAFRD
jgi:hypothetical protein